MKTDGISSHGCRPVSPVVRLLRLTEQALIFESRRRFDVGIFIDLGLHHPGGHSHHQREASPSFLSLEGYVVDCQTMLNGDSESYYQVTVLFSNLDAEDRCKLQGLAGKVHQETEAESSQRGHSVSDQLADALGLN